MVTQKRTATKEIIGNLMVFAVIMCPFSLIMHILKDFSAAVWSCFWLALVFIGLYWIRGRSKAFIIFVLAHLLFLGLPALALFFPQISLFFYAWLQTAALVFVIHSVYFQYKGEPVSGKVPFLIGTGFILLLNLAAGRFGVTGWTPLSIGLELFLAAGFIKLVNMENLDQSLEVLSAARTDMDSAYMYRFHNRLLLGLIGFTTFAAALAPSLTEGGITRILNALSQAFLNVIRWIVSLFNTDAEAATPTPMPFSPAPEMPPMAAEVRESSWLIQWIEKIIMVLAYILVIGALAGVVVYIIFRFYKSFAVKIRHNGDVIESLRRTDGETRIKGRRTFFRDFGQGSEKKIRRLYFRTISRQKHVTVRKTDTARDIQAKLGAHMDLASLTGAYEKARYGAPPK